MIWDLKELSLLKYPDVTPEVGPTHSEKIARAAAPQLILIDCLKRFPPQPAWVTFHPDLEKYTAEDLNQKGKGKLRWVDAELHRYALAAAIEADEQQRVKIRKAVEQLAIERADKLAIASELDKLRHRFEVSLGKRLQATKQHQQNNAVAFDKRQARVQRFDESQIAEILQKHTAEVAEAFGKLRQVRDKKQFLEMIARFTIS